jgi:hypothetical protein
MNFIYFYLIFIGIIACTNSISSTSTSTDLIQSPYYSPELTQTSLEPHSLQRRGILGTLGTLGALGGSAIFPPLAPVLLPIAGAGAASEGISLLTSFIPVILKLFSGLFSAFSKKE